MILDVLVTNSRRFLSNSKTALPLLLKGSSSSLLVLPKLNNSSSKLPLLPHLRLRRLPLLPLSNSSNSRLLPLLRLRPVTPSTVRTATVPLLLPLLHLKRVRGRLLRLGRRASTVRRFPLRFLLFFEG